ncbi:hypothetical protein ACJX0J_027802 [Zea mays]
MIWLTHIFPYCTLESLIKCTLPLLNYKTLDRELPLSERMHWQLIDKTILGIFLEVLFLDEQAEALPMNPFVMGSDIEGMHMDAMKQEKDPYTRTDWAGVCLELPYEGPLTYKERKRAHVGCQT